MSGEAVANGPPRLALSHRAVGFGPAVASGGDRTLEVALRNAGLSTLTVQGIDRTGDSEFGVLSAAGAALAFPIALAPGAEVLVRVRFQPSEHRREARHTSPSAATIPRRREALRHRRPGGQRRGLSTLAIVGIVAGAVVWRGPGRGGVRPGQAGHVAVPC
ncbi:MAG: hypothetical protein R3F43_18970 [bacterium]